MNRADRLPAYALIALGALLAAIALSADVIGLGSGGVGLAQAALLAAGGLSALAGILLLTPQGRARATGWGRHMRSACEPAGVLILAVFFGLVSGWGQVAVLFVRRNIRHEIISMGLDYPWLLPLANLGIFLLLGAVLHVLHRRRPDRFSLKLATGVLAFAAFFSLLLLARPIHKLALALLALGLAVQATRMIAARQRAFDTFARFAVGWPALLRRSPQPAPASGSPALPTRRDFVIGAGAAIAAAAVGVRVREATRERQSLARIPPVAGQPPNVLLIVLDTVRASSLSLHGYSRPTSPHLERLAAQGVTFTRAMAPASWTLPTHASMFTGRWPHELSTGPWSPLDATYPTLAEYLRDRGYLTAGFVANREYCSHEFGLSRGFIHYEDYRATPGQALLYTTLGSTAMREFPAVQRLQTYDNFGRKSAEQLTADFLRWQARAGSAQPFFAFLNYWDAHDPYTPPAEYARQFAPPGSRGGTPPTDPPDPETLAALQGHYDASIAYADEQVGALMDDLARRGILEETLVIILSDHGEHFGEHGLMLHGGSLYTQEIHVPLLALYPGQTPAGAVVNAPASLRNVAATVAEMAGLSQDAPFPGISLSRMWNGQSANDPVISEADKVQHLSERYPAAQGRLASLVQGNLHFIWHEFDSSEELYDLDSDPAEANNLAAQTAYQQELADLRATLQAALAA